jgi:hypothetical protein
VREFLRCAQAAPGRQRHLRLFKRAVRSSFGRKSWKTATPRRVAKQAGDQVASQLEMIERMKRVGLHRVAEKALRIIEKLQNGCMRGSKPVGTVSVD